MNKKDSFLAKCLLLPMSFFYGMVTATRNRLFEWGVLKQHEFNIPVICVGNIAVGGTGKTPHTEYLIAVLKDRFKIAMISRGYKRATKGFILANPHSSPRDIGDEAYQVYHKFGFKIPVAVCEDRVAGINRIREIHPDVNLIILDDAFQHRYVKPAISILLTEHNKPFYKDSMLPYGRLRESAKAVNRADVVIVTKCPDFIKPLDFRIMEKEINLIPAQSLFFSRYRYDKLRCVFPQGASNIFGLDALSENDSLLAVCGIANPRPFVRYLKSFNARVKVNVFADHHDFSRKDMNLILERFKSMKGHRKAIVTTEKDAVRLLNNPYFPPELKPFIFYQPVSVEFVRNENASLCDTVLKLISERF